MILNRKGLTKIAIYVVLFSAMIFYSTYFVKTFVLAASYISSNTCQYKQTTQNSCSPTTFTLVNCSSGTYRPSFNCQSSNPGCIPETGSSSCGGACTDCNVSGTCVSVNCTAGNKYGCASGNYCNNVSSCVSALPNGASCENICSGSNFVCASGNCGNGGAAICCDAGYVCCVSNSDCSSGFCLSNNCAVGTALNPAETVFNTFPFSFDFLNLSTNRNAANAKDYLTIFWNVNQPGAPNPVIGMNCTFAGTATVDCNPKPFVQAPGIGSCTVVSPPYNYAGLNNVSCFVFDTRYTASNATFNTSFYPVKFIANASLGGLTVGTQTTLRVKVQNIGLLADNYTVNVTVPSAPYIYIRVPFSSTGYLQGDPYDEIGFTSTSVVAQAAIGNPTMVILVNSTTFPQVGQRIEIKLTTGLASLADFTIFGIIQIIIFAALILLLVKK